jgi:hypothetical protein
LGGQAQLAQARQAVARIHAVGALQLDAHIGGGFGSGEPGRGLQPAVGVPTNASGLDVEPGERKLAATLFVGPGEGSAANRQATHVQFEGRTAIGRRGVAAWIEQIGGVELAVFVRNRARRRPSSWMRSTTTRWASSGSRLHADRGLFDAQEIAVAVAPGERGGRQAQFEAREHDQFKRPVEAQGALVALLGVAAQLGGQACAVEACMKIQRAAGHDRAEAAQREGQIFQVFETHFRRTHDPVAVILTQVPRHASRAAARSRRGRRSSKVLPLPTFAVDDHVAAVTFGHGFDDEQAETDAGGLVAAFTDRCARSA